MPSFVDEYYNENELVEELRRKLGFGSKRWLRKQRQLRQGPPWAEVGGVFVYHKGAAAAWLASLIQQPVRTRQHRNETARTAGLAP